MVHRSPKLQMYAAGEASGEFQTGTRIANQAIHEQAKEQSSSDQVN